MSGGLEPASLEPSCTEKTGIARMTISAVAAIADVRAWRVTKRPQRAIIVPSAPAVDASRRRVNGTRPLSMRGPSRLRIAGSSVIAAATAVTTVIAAPRPSLVMKSSPITARAEIEIATVRPANTTARPAVATAPAAASSPLRPSWIPWRKRVRMNRA